MNCNEFKSRLDFYIDGDLSPEERAAMQKHAQECESCNEELKFALMLGDMLSEAAEEITPPLPAQAAWRNAVRAESRRRNMTLRFRRMGAVAAVMAVMVGGMAFIRSQGLMGQDSAATPVAANDSGIVYVATDGSEESGMRSLSLMTEEPAGGITASVRLISQDVENSASSVEGLVGDFGGTISDSSLTSGTAYITAEIPSEELDAFVESLEYAGKVDSSRISGEDGETAAVSVTIKSE